MATDTINPPLAPQRVFYSTGRMLGVADFQADQDYHRGRLARALVTLYGAGTVSGLLVQVNANEIQVTPGMAIDRIGRIIEAPRTVCIDPNAWLQQQIQAWQNQQTNPVPGQPAIADPNTAIHDGHHLMVDVFATFVSCTRGATPCFAAEDDYDATDAFAANRYLDSFAMQLVLRTDPTPGLPVDPWKAGGAMPGAGAGLTAITAANLTALQNLLLAGTAGPAAAPSEYPPGFDTTSVFLARLLIAATPGAPGNPPTWNVTGISIDNNSRLFLYPAGLLARLGGFASGSEA